MPRGPIRSGRSHLNASAPRASRARLARAVLEPSRPQSSRALEQRSRATVQLYNYSRGPVVGSTAGGSVAAHATAPRQRRVSAPPRHANANRRAARVSWAPRSANRHLRGQSPASVPALPQRGAAASPRRGPAAPVPLAADGRDGLLADIQNGGPATRGLTQTSLSSQQEPPPSVKRVRHTVTATPPFLP